MFNRIRERLQRGKSAEEQEAQQKPAEAPQQETPPPAEVTRPATPHQPAGTPALQVPAPPQPPATKIPTTPANPPVTQSSAPPAVKPTPAPVEKLVPPPVIQSTPPPLMNSAPAPVEKLAAPPVAKPTPPITPSAPLPAMQSAPAPAASPAPSPVPPSAPAQVPAASAAEEEEWEDEDFEEEEHKGGRPAFRNPFSQSLSRTRQMFGKVSEAFQRGQIDDQLWDDLEETLITSDVGVAITERLVETLKERVEYAGLKDARDVRDALEEELLILLGDPEPLNFSTTSPLTVILVVGVNGVGKTTTIAKLTQYLKKKGHRVILAAGDTFRAAAIDQIKIWGERVKVPVISHQHGADPGAVVFDALEAAENRKCDVLIIDTAGRLHTKYNLMEELKKIAKVLGKKDPEAPQEVLLVVDATTGQNALLQAKQFVGDVGLTGLVLTKLDGTARGGIVFSISEELGLPIKFIGTGERVGDLAPFDPEAFVQALFATDGA
ncbi:MAG TPA: signal recognition particle-docking protein FtsY [Ktedonobacterales bacterium]